MSGHDALRSARYSLSLIWLPSSASLTAYQEQLDRGLLVRIIERRLNRSPHALTGIADQTGEASFPTSSDTRIECSSTRVDL